MNFLKQLRWLAAVAATALMLAAAPLIKAQVAVGVSVNFAPPELPVYEQPICPGDGYIWTPGYWAWDLDFDDYYWVPGTWVLPPEVGFLWTPGYWGWSGSAFVFYAGYWGPQVGFYGGIDYGFGYSGHGYEGGRWQGGHFYYNRSVNNVNVTEIHNVYNTTVVNRDVTRVSFNGGNGGVNARPTAEEQAVAHGRHVGAVAAQQQQINAAKADRSLRASQNHGKPPVAATPRAGAFSGGGVAAAKSGANYNPPANRAYGGGREERPPNAASETAPNRPTYVHPNDLPKVNRSQPPSSGNAKADQKYQQQMNKMYQKQEQDRQKLQQRQDQEHARAAQKQENAAQKQQMEQRHQQQTQQMEQRHTQQQQKMTRQAPPPKAQPPHGEQPRH